MLKRIIVLNLLILISSCSNNESPEMNNIERIGTYVTELNAGEFKINPPEWIIGDWKGGLTNDYNIFKFYESDMTREGWNNGSMTISFNYSERYDNVPIKLTETYTENSYFYKLEGNITFLISNEKFVLNQNGTISQFYGNNSGFTYTKID